MTTGFDINELGLSESSACFWPQAFTSTSMAAIVKDGRVSSIRHHPRRREGTAHGLEEPEVARLDAAKLVVINLDALNAAALGKRLGLRLD